MDETTNSSETSANLIWDNTTTTTDGVINWTADFNFTSWEPYLYEKYTPKWHIEKGYKIQIKQMWDNKKRK